MSGLESRAPTESSPQISLLLRAHGAEGACERDENLGRRLASNSGQRTLAEALSDEHKTMNPFQRDNLPRFLARRLFIGWGIIGLALVGTCFFVMTDLRATRGVHIQPSGLRWGEAVGGLQMAVYVRTNGSVVQCWIRNATTNKIAYNRYFLGYWENVGVEVRTNGGWIELGRVHLKVRCVKSVGPRAENIVGLEPLEIIPYGDDINDITNFGAPFGNASFGVHLGGFIWPSDVLKTADCEVRVKQLLRGPGHEVPITIYSPPFRMERVKVRSVRGLLEMFQRDEKPQRPAEAGR